MNDCGQLFNIPMCITSHPVSRLQNVAGFFDSARNIKDFTLDWTCNHGGYIQVPLTETTISLRRSKKRQIAVTQIINAVECWPCPSTDANEHFDDPPVSRGKSGRSANFVQNKHFFAIRQDCAVDIIVIELVKYRIWHYYKRIDKLCPRLNSSSYSIPFATICRDKQIKK